MTRKPRSGPECQIGYYADFVSRLLAFFIDVATISITFTIFVWLVNVTITTMQFRTVLNFSLRGLPYILTALDELFSAQRLVVWLVMYSFGYHFLFLLLTGQTVGKAIMGLRVVAIDGSRLNFLRAFMRMIVFFFSVFFFGLGVLWILIDDRRQALHDKLSGTYVIYTWDAIPDEQFLASQVEKNSNALSDPDSHSPPSPSLGKHS